MSFNVLIVDDSNSMRAVIKKIISISGFKMDNCYEAGNGVEALEVLSKSWVDIILSDINMPEMNGLELLNRLKQDELYRDIPFIVITTEGSSERMEEAFNCGARGFIKKPFLPEDVKRILHEVIGVDEDGKYQEDQRDADDLDF
jgi:two-component system, chemotaxis family, chemotaxis protein CheY